MKTTLDYIEANGNEGHSFSLGSMTDLQEPANVPPFTNKSIEVEGTPYDVQKYGIGYACKKGLKADSPNQDSFLILKVGDHHCLYGVFDGHGRRGHDVSNFIKDNFPKILFSQENFMDSPDLAISKTFKKLQHLIEKATVMNQIDARRSGSTASIVLHDVKNNALYIAHVGDSRVVLAEEKKGGDGKMSVQATDLTVDHKPNHPAERKRIEQAGGVVVFDGGWNHRVYAKSRDKHGRPYPGLNMSRAMGDLQGYHDAGISATPDISRWDLSGTTNGQINGVKIIHDKLDSTDKFMLLGSDGIWEFVSSAAAVEIVNGYPLEEAQSAAEHLATAAWDKWVDEMNGEVVDDITILVVHLTGRPDIRSEVHLEVKTANETDGSGQIDWREDTGVERPHVEKTFEKIPVIPLPPWREYSDVSRTVEDVSKQV